MANFTSSMSAAVSTSDGASLSRTLSNQGLNAKVMLDDIFTSGTHDLSGYLTSIAAPKFILILVGGTLGATVNLDGVGASTLKMKTMLLEVTSASAADIELVTAETARIQMIALGDAD